MSDYNIFCSDNIYIICELQIHRCETRDLGEKIHKYYEIISKKSDNFNISEIEIINRYYSEFCKEKEKELNNCSKIKEINSYLRQKFKKLWNSKLCSTNNCWKKLFKLCN